MRPRKAPKLPVELPELCQVCEQGEWTALWTSRLSVTQLGCGSQHTEVLGTGDTEQTRGSALGGSWLVVPDLCLGGAGVGGACDAAVVGGGGKG